jgi:hypothetical protein
MAVDSAFQATEMLFSNFRVATAYPIDLSSEHAPAYLVYFYLFHTHMYHVSHAGLGLQQSP